MKELHCILVSYFMIRQLKHEIPMNIHYFHKNGNINSYLNQHPPSWDIRYDITLMPVLCGVNGCPRFVSILGDQSTTTSTDIWTDRLTIQ
jgi:hypothetical protein